MNLRLRIVFSLLGHLYEVPYLTSEATLQECTDLSASMSIREHRVHRRCSVINDETTS